MTKTRVIAKYNFFTANIATNTISFVDVSTPLTSNLNYLFSNPNEFDFGLITGSTNIDNTLFEDWGSIE